MSKKNSMGILQIVGLLFFLVILPGGSWYYLRKGLDYRMSALEELEEIGPMPIFGTIYHNEEALTKAHLEGNIVISSFLDVQNNPTKDVFGQLLQKLHHQFDARDDIRFYTYVIGGQSDSTGMLADFIEKYDLQDTAQCYFLLADDSLIRQQATEGYRLPLTEGQSLENQPIMVYTDGNGMIRAYYDIQIEERQKRLVEHIAMLMPRKKDRELYFKREKEK